jgi:hypothetical protein
MPVMKQTGNPSPAQLVLRACFGALFGASCFLLLYLGPHVTHGQGHRNWFVALSLDFVSPIALLLPGFAIVYQATSRIEQGVDGEDWSSNELDPLRRIVRVLVHATSAFYLAGIIVWTIRICTGGYYSERLRLWDWVWFTLVITFIELRRVLTSKPKSSSTPKWNDLKPIHSDHWGEMNHPAS